MEMYDVAPVGYLTLTHEGLIAEINLTAADLLGADRQELLSRCFDAIVTPQDGDSWHYFFSGVMEHHMRQAIELTLKRSDGAEFPVQLDCRYVMCGDQDSRLCITLTDITSGKQEHAALGEIEMNTAQILANAGLGSWDWDIKTGRVIFNECWAKLRGYRLEE